MQPFVSRAGGAGRRGFAFVASAEHVTSQQFNPSEISSTCHDPTNDRADSCEDVEVPANHRARVRRGIRSCSARRAPTRPLVAAFPSRLRPHASNNGGDVCARRGCPRVLDAPQMRPIHGLGDEARVSGPNHPADQHGSGPRRAPRTPRNQGAPPVARRPRCRRLGSHDERSIAGAIDPLVHASSADAWRRLVGADGRRVWRRRRPDRRRPRSRWKTPSRRWTRTRGRTE